MLANILTVSAGELNSGSAIKSVVDRTVTKIEGDLSIIKYYRPTQIRFTNSTGNTIHFLPLNETEYASYLASTLLTDLIPVVQSGVMTIESTKDGEISQLLVSGTTGHSSSLSITLFQE